eukprot:tig00001067_g6763.t1
MLILSCTLFCFQALLLARHKEHGGVVSVLQLAIFVPLLAGIGRDAFGMAFLSSCHLRTGQACSDGLAWAFACLQALTEMFIWALAGAAAAFSLCSAAVDALFGAPRIGQVFVPGPALAHLPDPAAHAAQGQLLLIREHGVDPRTTPAHKKYNLFKAFRLTASTYFGLSLALQLIFRAALAWPMHYSIFQAGVDLVLYAVLWSAPPAPARPPRPPPLTARGARSVIFRFRKRCPVFTRLPAARLASEAEVLGEGEGPAGAQEGSRAVLRAWNPGEGLPEAPYTILVENPGAKEAAGVPISGIQLATVSAAPATPELDPEAAAAAGPGPRRPSLSPELAGEVVAGHRAGRVAGLSLSPLPEPRFELGEPGDFPELGPLDPASRPAAGPAPRPALLSPWPPAGPPGPSAPTSPSLAADSGEELSSVVVAASAAETPTPAPGKRSPSPPPSPRSGRPADASEE